MSEGLGLAVIGLGAGIAVALGVSRLLETMLFDVKPVDVPVYLTVSAGVVMAVLFAAWMPAWRAAKLDPASILRRE